MQDWTSDDAVRRLASQKVTVIDTTQPTRYLKFFPFLNNSCQNIFTNIGTWGVKSRSRNTIFVLVPMESLSRDVRPDMAEPFTAQQTFLST